MSDLMRAIPFDKLIEWMLREYADKGSVFGIRKDKFYKNETGSYLSIFGEKISMPIGPAAGPNSQLSQNIVAAYLTGSRFVELKTVQIMDGEELRKCVAKPCIKAEDECYNVEWSTELTVPEAAAEYIKAWLALHVACREFDLGAKDIGRDFTFNMSVGYDLDGITSPKINSFIDVMKDAKGSEVFQECQNYLLNNLDKFQKLTRENIEEISGRICPSITLSTLHGCPPQEIERITRYLLQEKRLHTYIKCNPTILGYDFARNILNEMGYDYIAFDDHHFKNDLQYADGIKMFAGLMELAKELNLEFGVKITNTFPVKIKNNELAGEEMYMSGRALFPLSISVANKLSQSFAGKLPISYSGGADYFNIAEIFETGIRPITIATTILKPGGYERIAQLANILEPLIEKQPSQIDTAALDKLAKEVVHKKYYLKNHRHVASRKTESKLGLFDCFKAPCQQGGCPIEQQIPAYLKLVREKNYDRAFQVIAVDNASPAITGTICNHKCQTKCTRLDYDAPLAIRNMKGLAVANAQDAFIGNLTAPKLKTNKKVAVIGAGPAGVAAALFLRRNGVPATVLEKRAKPFGIVQYVIPEFRIADSVIEKDFQLAQKTGVEFKFNAAENYSIADLKKDYDYVVLATGAWAAGASPVKEGAEKIWDALKFLEESKIQKTNLDLGKKVAVIGGGNVAMDAARAAKCAPGVEEAAIVYRRTKAFMPADYEEIELAEKDGVQMMELLAPLSYDGVWLECEVMELSEKDASGRKSVKGTGVIKKMQFDKVIGAVGSRVDTALFTQNGLAINDKGYLEINQHNETSIPGVYVAGDCKEGPATIVKAIADAKIIAKDILRKLGLEHDFVKVEAEICAELSDLYYKKGILTESSMQEEEGYRCLECDKLCEICCDVCPNRANVEINVGSGLFKKERQILHLDGMCNECGNCGVFCPHAGNPYQDKLTCFWTEEDFADSANKGFLYLGENKFKVRKEDGSVITHTAGDKNISEQMAAVLKAVVNNYPYYLG